MKLFDAFVFLSRELSQIRVTLNVKVFFCSNKQVFGCFPFYAANGCSRCARTVNVQSTDKTKVAAGIKLPLMAIEFLFSVVIAPKGIVSQSIQITPYVFQFK